MSDVRNPGRTSGARHGYDVIVECPVDEPPTSGVAEDMCRLAVEIGILVPGFVRTEGAKRVIENALERLKRRVEMG